MRGKKAFRFATVIEAFVERGEIVSFLRTRYVRSVWEGKNNGGRGLKWGGVGGGVGIEFS